jgi:hypothetical protein
MATASLVLGTETIAQTVESRTRHTASFGTVALRGWFRVLVLYDVAEAIRLEQVRSILGAQPSWHKPSFTRPAPDYVRFEPAPVLEPIDEVDPKTGERLKGRINYYEYGVVSVELEQEFACTWDTLVEQSSSWMADPRLEKRALNMAERSLKRAARALVKPNENWLTEDYYIVQLHEIQEPEGRSAIASDLLSGHGHAIAQIVRGESVALSDAELQEILQSSTSYTSTDLLVVGWTGALVYDTPEGAAHTIQLLEYANTQLLEFRYYDNLLTRVLKGVYASLERKRSFLSRWRLAREAERLNTIRLDVIELTERIDNSIKFLSDMFCARLYRLAAAKVGVPDYRNLVDQKLRTAGQLYEFMVQEFHQARAFVLELVVVVILIIELFLLFRGKPA